MTKREYTPKEKRDAVRLAGKEGVKSASASLGIPRGTLNKWKYSQPRKAKKPKKRQSTGAARVNEVLAGIDSRKHAMNDADPLEAVLRLANGARRVEFHRIIVERE